MNEANENEVRELLSETKFTATQTKKTGDIVRISKVKFSPKATTSSGQKNFANLKRFYTEVQ